ncbi:LysR family transcriptional regulator [Herbaspirillum seropedicae]|uniref:Transcription regulator protein n=1 Tax=Herbaspirillum seropedicae (strain SmR1) TaxID=757424 RepID=D8J0W4_HERSS|nr:LysR family transcriptional regulator [Herbaspirillum seropedicae]WGZ76228.1 FdeR [Vector pJYP1]ADJ62519.1 transcription regulator protein [Herbaspirillum seropedicae SmR1]AKN64635.1 nodulation protein NfeD [Herbaspirillum seropedicae]NQE30943.1 nodulation protein NfeD [Herbaspirillum seropedicae]UMU20575.1 LysR family transcriptional regulator [Herbaspirillum seropedicae]
MRFNKLDLNLLVALDALLTEMSISRAAEKIHLSQSAMSNALARLREYFDDELLIQVGRRMEPTPRAEVLKDAVHDVLRRIDGSIAALPAFVPAESTREFRISVSDFTLSVLIPRVLARAHAEGKHIRFALMPQVQDPTRSLDRAEVDLLVLPQEFCTPDHPAEEVFRERHVCVVWRDSALAQGELTLERYMASGHVVMVPPGANASSVEAWMARKLGFARRVEVTSFSFASALALVQGTDRIATVHARLAQLLAPQWPVVIKESPLSLGEMRQMMQWHRYRSNDPGIQWLRRVFLESAQEMDAALPGIC